MARPFVLLLGLVCGRLSPSVAESSRRCRVDNEDDGCITRSSLDALAQMMGESYRDWDRLSTCFEEISTQDVDMTKVVDAGWRGFIEYNDQMGALHDSNQSRTRRRLADLDPQPMYTDDGGQSYLMVPEPCNTLSSFSFYRSMWAFCEMDRTWTFDDDIRKTLAQLHGILAWSAAFMHAESDDSSVGQQLDYLSISLITLVGYQGAMQKFRDSESPLFTLQADPIYSSGVEATKEYARIIMEGDVMRWSQQFEELQQSIPDVYSPFYGTLGITLHLILPPTAARSLLGLANRILGRSSSGISDLWEGLRSVTPDLSTRLSLARMLTGTLIKGVYSMVFVDSEDDPRANLKGALSMPIVNAIGNRITGFDRLSTDPNVQHCVNVYPGDRECRNKVSRAKWLEQFANALVDLHLVGNEVNKIIGGESLEFNADNDIQLLQCYEANDCMSDFDVDIISSYVSTALDTCMDQISVRWNVSSFATCVLSSLLTNGNQVTADTKHSNAPATLDSCLLENSCLAFNDRFALDQEKLLDCVTGSFRPACASFVNRNDLRSCTSSCSDTDGLCILDCVQLYGSVSPTFQSTVGCLNAVFRVDSHTSEEDMARYKRTCQQQPEFIMDHTVKQSSFENAFSTGMRRLSMCSAEHCNHQRVDLLQTVETLSICAAKCMDEMSVSPSSSEQSRLFPQSASIIAPPQWLNCALECYIVHG